MTNNIAVKTAVAKDAGLIESLAKEIWTQHYLPIIGQAQIDYMLNKYQSKKAIRHDIASGYIYYIAYLEGAACGYSAIIPPQDCASAGTAVNSADGLFLSKFYVRKTARGRGIGKAMLSTILTFSKQHSITRIWLTCNKHNTATLDVYRRLGFSVTDSVVTNIGGGFVMDDYILEKRFKQNN